MLKLIIMSKIVRSVGGREDIYNSHGTNESFCDFGESHS